jgi:HK97 family phage major capsid protein
MNLQELYAKRKAAVEAYDAIVAAARAENREYTAEEEAALDGHLAEAKAATAEIERLQRQANREAERAAIASQGGTGRRTMTEQASASDTVPGDYQPGRVRVEGQASRHDAQRGFRHAGEFYAAVAAAGTPGARVDDRLEFHTAASGMNQNSGADGGFAVPPAYSTEIWDGLSSDPDNLLPMTDGYTVDGESLTFLANAETSRATGSRYGGVRGYWIAEADQITSSNPKLRRVKIEPQQLAVLVYVTDKLLRNAPAALRQYVNRSATAEINWLTSDAIVNGTGVGKPKGLLVSSARVTVAKETGQGAQTLVANNIIKMWSRCHARARRNAVWLINQDIEPQLYTLSLPVGAGGAPIFLPQGGLSTSPYASLFGRPVMPSEYCQTLGTEGDIILTDLKAYLSGTRGGVDEQMSMHLRFDYAETAFRFMYEVDGQPWTASAITPAKSSNTLSPIVTLAARA